MTTTWEETQQKVLNEPIYTGSGFWGSSGGTLSLCVILGVIGMIILYIGGVYTNYPEYVQIGNLITLVGVLVTDVPFVSWLIYHLYIKQR